MSDLPVPDREDAHTLGMWRLEYALAPGLTLWFVRAGTRRATDDPAREWLVAAVGAARLAADLALRSLPMIGTATIDGRDFLLVRERDLGAVLASARAAFAPDPARHG